VYEFSTETLFFGRQDAMQRTTLLPLVDYIRARGLDPARMQVAEVGCGTGRFHTFIKVSGAWGICCGFWHTYFLQYEGSVTMLIT
jgi:hypothetical protein